MTDYFSFQSLKDNRALLMEWSESNYVLTVIGFIGVYYLAVTFSLPGAVWMTLAGGFIFGTLAGTVFVVVGATAGATALFLAARYAFADLLRAKANAAIVRMEDGFRDDAMSYLLVLRLVPLFPFWLVNLVPAFLGVPLRTFVIGTFFGIMPGTFVYSSVGNGLAMLIDKGEMPNMGIIFEPSIITPLIGLALLAMIPVAYKKYKAKKV